MPSPMEMVEQLIAHMDGRPMWEVMRADETARGFTVILPGAEAWLPAEDWDPTITVSRARHEVRLVAILAKHPGHGAFRRLVSAILAAKLVPVIIAPTVHMRETMRRWGWKPRHVGSGWDHEEQWRPPKGWCLKPVMDSSNAWKLSPHILYRDPSGQLRDRPSPNDTSVQGKRK